MRDEKEVFVDDVVEKMQKAFEQVVRELLDAFNDDTDKLKERLIDLGRRLPASFDVITNNSKLFVQNYIYLKSIGIEDPFECLVSKPELFFLATEHVARMLSGISVDDINEYPAGIVDLIAKKYH